jgi:hypothetical protein
VIASVDQKRDICCQQTPQPCFDFVTLIDIVAGTDAVLTSEGRKFARPVMFKNIEPLNIWLKEFYSESARQNWQLNQTVNKDGMV